MFVVDNVLISDDLVEAAFCCDLGACLGACCVQGDSGAPLEEEEIPALDAVLPVVRSTLRPEALKVIEKDGTVYFAMIPGVYSLKDLDGDGKLAIALTFIPYKFEREDQSRDDKDKVNPDDNDDPLGGNLFK